jgi:hypothetical protein
MELPLRKLSARWNTINKKPGNRDGKSCSSLSVRKLAVAARVSPQTVMRFERGEKLRVLEAAGIEFIYGRKPGNSLELRCARLRTMTRTVSASSCLLLGLEARTFKTFISGGLQVVAWSQPSLRRQKRLDPFWVI